MRHDEPIVVGDDVVHDPWADALIELMAAGFGPQAQQYMDERMFLGLETTAACLRQLLERLRAAS